MRNEAVDIYIQVIAAAIVCCPSSDQTMVQRQSSNVRNIASFLLRQCCLRNKATLAALVYWSDVEALNAILWYDIYKLLAFFP